MKINFKTARSLPYKLEGLEFSKALKFLHEEELDLIQQVQNPRTRAQAAPKYEQYRRIVAQFEQTGLTAYAVQAANFAYRSPGQA